MTIYISIPITGYDYNRQRLKALRIEMALLKSGHKVINPFKVADYLDSLYKRLGIKNPTDEEYLHYELMLIRVHVGAIYLAKGWSNSKGCMKEVDEGIKKGVKFIIE
jgi:hypothetical protein